MQMVESKVLPPIFSRFHPIVKVKKRIAQTRLAQEKLSIPMAHNVNLHTVLYAEFRPK